MSDVKLYYSPCNMDMVESEKGGRVKLSDHQATKGVNRMTTIDKLRADVRHEEGCPCSREQESLVAEGIGLGHEFVSNGAEFPECTVCAGIPEDHECTCSYREKMAFLDRLENTTKAMARDLQALRNFLRNIEPCSKQRRRNDDQAD